LLRFLARKNLKRKREIKQKKILAQCAAILAAMQRKILAQCAAILAAMQRKEGSTWTKVQVCLT
jgi:hypothetical protein